MDLLDDGSISTFVKGVKISLNKETLGIILDVTTTVIHSIEGCRPSMVFTELASKKGEPKKAGVTKKYLKGKY